jgi:hypothetical protein
MIMMRSLSIAAITIFMLALGHIAAADTPDAKTTYKAATEQATADYKVAREKCNSFSGTDKDICIAEADAAKTRSNATAEAQYKNTPQAMLNARKAIANADYKVAEAKCNKEAGNDKDVCIKRAKADNVAAFADAKSDKSIATSRNEAQEDKQDANYKLAIQKCDALAGDAKNHCISDAKTRYGK